MISIDDRNVNISIVTTLIFWIFVVVQLMIRIFVVSLSKIIVDKVLSPFD